PAADEPAGAASAAPAARGEEARPRDAGPVLRQLAHDLNQPLTVILGYAALLGRGADEALRAEAASRILEEARKMSALVGRLSRLARGLDAA
ncbi:MAG TPA: histidine kinase dimerization/phospho-acceptor domain-containing protein, partial [Thermodesulfobacteriota bacterium]|nr:histidine kinase dimerization/phospho-acceptor domain-containing protein [Thermodesulfobacteriota bacterium]